MNCSKYDYCSAPICKMEMIENARWFPGEEICNKLGQVTRQQRKIAKRTKNADTYYTLDMLKHDCRIKSGIKGLAPDKPESWQKKKWFSQHKEITKEQRESMRVRFHNIDSKAQKGVFPRHILGHSCTSNTI